MATTKKVQGPKNVARLNADMMGAALRQLFEVLKAIRAAGKIDALAWPALIGAVFAVIAAYIAPAAMAQVRQAAKKAGVSVPRAGAADRYLRRAAAR